MLKRMVALVLIVLLNSSFANALAQAPAENSRGLLSHQAPHEIQTSLGPFLVYEGVRNTLLKDSDKVYYVAPHIAFLGDSNGVLKIDAVHYGSLSNVTFSLVLQYPEAREAVSALRTINRHVSPTNVTQLRFTNLKCSHGLFETFYAVEPGAESDVSLSNTELAVTLTSYEDDQAIDTFVDAMKAGRVTVQLSGMIRFARTGLNSMSVSWQEIADSKSFRDFEQDAGEKAVVAYQLGELSMNVLREIRVDLWDELGDESTGFLSALDAINRELFTNVKESYVDVATLRDVLSDYEIDLSSDAFQPSVVTEVVADVKNMSKSEWKKNYKDQVEDSFRYSAEGNSKASGKVSVLKIFGGGGGYEKAWERMTDTQKKEYLERNDYYYNEYDRSFKVKKAGKMIERVSVRVYSNVPVSVERNVQVNSTATRVTWVDGRWVPLLVSEVTRGRVGLGDMLPIQPQEY